ncbi:MAG: biotin/lipoyl-binding protein [Candidatus Marinimicrobia bacterium]|nr:biotin/lipoyl-binding protein [Candidatus Neomarinimicrobiota bacterium]MCF7827951.1 biotin/lipoyl-binding protein [Candidatus Neomarinimicrobiota bacterium]MCF7879294.1 biotin/lipoyl-binding protein [Candidatus Neomarinimicrobiota bacterium]
MKYVAAIEEQEVELSVEANGRIMEIRLAESGDIIDYERISPTRYSVLLDGQSYLLQVEPNGAGFEVTHRNQSVDVILKDEVDLIRERYGMGKKAAEMHGVVKAPIPGKVVEIEVEEGQTVAPDDGLMSLEAMKMENEIKAPIGGVIAKIHVQQNESIEKDTILLEIDSE